MKIQYQVIVNTLPQDAPYDFEMSAALILANYFKTDVVFLRSGRMKSPDLMIGKDLWELKSPKGNSKNTIRNNIKNARKQSKNIVIDLRRCKMNKTNAVLRIRDMYKKRKRKNGSFLIIEDDKNVFDIRDII